MSHLPHTPVLECQDCGEVVRYLSDAEAARVADHPYDFIAYCRQCASHHVPAAEE